VFVVWPSRVSAFFARSRPTLRSLTSRDLDNRGEVKQTPQVLLYVLTAVLAGLLGYAARRFVAEGKVRSAEEQAAAILEQAARDAEAKVREALVEAKE